jgi:ABC-type Fe3+ transport system permease subunit
VPWYQTIFGGVLVVVLVALSVYFGRLQILELRKLRQNADVLPNEEIRYERRKAYRRLVSSALLMVLAVLLVVLLTYELPAQEIVEQRKALGDNLQLSEEQKEFVRTWGWTWMSFLVVLMAVIVLAGIDLMSTRLYAIRQFRKLHADRRAMIERQAQRMRQQRNGHG